MRILFATREANYTTRRRFASEPLERDPEGYCSYFVARGKGSTKSLVCTQPNVTRPSNFGPVPT